MKARVFPIVFIAILLLIACKKEPPSGNTGPEYVHWPVVKTLEASKVDSTTALLNGTINSYGLSTTVIFEYGTTISYGSTVTASESPVTQNGLTNVSADISGLTCGITYHFRIKAENSKWINFYSPDSTFTSGHIPTLKTTSISGISTTTAISGGNIIYNGCPAITIRGVCWSTTGNPTTSDSKTSDGVASGSYVSNVIGLTAATTYHIRAYATNSAGTAYGNDVSFSTGQVPTISSFGVTNLPSYIATLYSTINANNFSSVVSFEYGTTISYGQEVTSEQNPVIGNTNTDVFVTLTGLTCGTTYHFRVKAENSYGTVYSDDKTFNYEQIPALITDSVSGITATTAISGGNIINDGCAAITARGVRWSTHKPPWIFVVTKYTNDSTGTGSFTSNLTGLSPNTTYYVRAYATNSAGTAFGNFISFTTLP
jgi:hypothetical protein